MSKAHIQWAYNVLEKQNYQIQMEPDIIQDNPWSTVYRFKTNQGFIFLKKVPANLSLEPNVIKLLQTAFHANVPIIIANNPEQHCFLMQDAGIQMYHYFRQHLNFDIFIQTLQSYAELQIATMKNTQPFFALGVPDWHTEKLPMLYQELISDEGLLSEDGLSHDEIIRLKYLEPQFKFLCKKLADYKIKDSFCHADFHDKNILINPNTHQSTIIDLGEVAISYPIFSLHNCLHMFRENFALTENQYRQITQQCLAPWLELESEKNLLEILSIVKQCWSIPAALGEYRLINSVGKNDLQKLKGQGRFSNKLRYWLDDKH